MDYVVIKLIKDPFLHFMVIGAGLFIAYGLTVDESAEKENQITISQLDVNNTIKRWKQRWQRLPSDEELQIVIEKKVRQEVFYREALALDLGKDDPVIRRRLAEKMMFIANDLLVPEQASDAQLLAFMKASPAQFSKPISTSFQHVYFNPDLHSMGTNSFNVEVQKYKGELNETDSTVVSYQSIGDDFYDEKSYQNLPSHQVARLFGQEFTQGLTQAPIGEWYGPINSGYGQHLVKLEQRSKPTLLPLGEIREDVLIQWKAAQQQQSNDSLYEELKSTYHIVIELPKKIEKGNES